MGVIFILSHQAFEAPKEPLPWYIQLLESLRPLPPDKVVHFGLYAILALFGCWPLGSRPLVLGFICIAYGFLDEWHQSFIPGRHPDLWDVLADSFGAVITILVFKLMVGRLRKRATIST